MSHKRNEALRHVQHSMHHVIAAGEGSDRAPDSCKLCPYYRPDFKFRTCLYAHCPYKKQVNVFRSTPEKWDINASRLFSCLYGQPLAVGRVMTPVLAMTVVREAAIAAFTPEKFYTVALALADGGTASSKRFAQKADAELLLSKCRKEGRATVQKMERKEKSESPPQLYDLTALQRDANRLLGFTAQ